MNDFYITVSTGLLKNGHPKRMGNAVWLFLWLLDHMTSQDGLVLGGKPVQYTDINKDLELPLRTYRRWINLLKQENYISVKTAPYGLIITIKKPKKVYKQAISRSANNGTPEPKREVPIMAHLTDNSGTPEANL